MVPGVKNDPLLPLIKALVIKARSVGTEPPGIILRANGQALPDLVYGCARIRSSGQSHIERVLPFVCNYVTKKQ